MDHRIGISIISAFVGAFILYWFFWPEFTTEVEIVETQTTDTTYAHYKEKYRIDSVKWVSLNDSIDFYKTKYQKKLNEKNIVIAHESEFVDKPIIAPLRRFNGQRAFLYGNVYFSSLVAGEMIEIDITTDFNIPIVNNTITRTETNTIIKKPRALYVGAGVNSLISPFAKVDYLDNQFIFSYQYYPIDRIHTVGIGKKLF